MQLLDTFVAGTLEHLGDECEAKPFMHPIDAGKNFLRINRDIDAFESGFAIATVVAGFRCAVIAKIIDDEVENLITEAAHRAREVIKANKHKLEELKQALLLKETVEADEVEEILKDSRMPSSAALY